MCVKLLYCAIFLIIKPSLHAWQLMTYFRTIKKIVTFCFSSMTFNFINCQSFLTTTLMVKFLYCEKGEQMLLQHCMWLGDRVNHQTALFLLLRCQFPHSLCLYFHMRVMTLPLLVYFMLDASWDILSFLLWKCCWDFFFFFFFKAQWTWFWLVNFTI